MISNWTINLRRQVDVIGVTSPPQPVATAPRKFW
jgi:hypothetical protein